jgi:hypothetical protein
MAVAANHGWPYMSLNQVGAIAGVAVISGILFLYGCDRTHEVAAPKPHVVVTTKRPAAVPLPTSKPVTKPARAPVSSPFCEQVKAVVAEHGKAWAEARAKELGYTPAQVASVEHCLN